MKETAILGLVHYEFAVHSILQWNDDWKFVGNKWGINKSLEKCCWHWCVYVCNRVSSFIIIIYPLTARVVGESQIVSQLVSSIFLCSPLPSGTWRTSVLPIPWCCLPTSFSVCLVFLLLQLCLARWFWPDLMSGRHVHYHCSVRFFTTVRRYSCDPIASWILHRLLRW